MTPFGDMAHAALLVIRDVEALIGDDLADSDGAAPAWPATRDDITKGPTVAKVRRVAATWWDHLTVEARTAVEALPWPEKPLHKQACMHHLCGPDCTPGAGGTWGDEALANVTSHHQAGARCTCDRPPPTREKRERVLAAWLDDKAHDMRVDREDVTATCGFDLVAEIEALATEVRGRATTSLARDLAELDDVPSIHASHRFPTEEERAAMPEQDRPFAEGCGGCACLPGDEEAALPCSPPVPLFCSCRVDLAREWLTDPDPLAVFCNGCGAYEGQSCNVQRGARRQLLGALAARVEQKAGPGDRLRFALDFAAEHLRGNMHPEHAPAAQRIAALARELAWTRVMLAGMLRPVEGAYAASQQGQGQRAGSPRMQAPPLSVLVHLRREVEDALAGAPPESSVSMDSLLQAMSDREQETGRLRRDDVQGVPMTDRTIHTYPSGDTNDTAALLAAVRARLGPEQLGARCTVRFGVYGAPRCDVKWVIHATLSR